MMLDSWYIFVWDNIFTLLGWVIALAALIWVPFRRPASEARSWLLIFFILPWLAVFLYWLIGRPLHAKPRRKRFAYLPIIFDRIVKRARINSAEFAPGLDDDNESTARLVRGMGQLPALTGNNVELLSDYDAVYDRIIADIDAARHHVHLEFFIFTNDGVGDRIMAALEQANDRGVTCRLLIDAMGSFGWARSVKRRLGRSGIEVHDILPLWRRWNSSRLDLRNHRKIVVIDGEIGYTGSQNIWEPMAHARRANQELFVRLTGPVVIELQAIFTADWYLETQAELTGGALFPLPIVKGSTAMQILASGPDYPDGGVDLIFAHAIHNAAREVVIATPYFIPNDALVSAIKYAVLSGVAVRLIVPRKSDHILVELAQHSYYAELLAIGVEIYLFGPEFLHAKHFRVDDELVIIGSSNMDLRSFELNAEIDLICFGDAVAHRVKALEARHLTHCEALVLDDWRKRPLALKILENSARLMSDLI